MSPVTVQPMVPPVVHVFEPGLLVTVYPVIELPPVEPGAVQVTAAVVLPGVADTAVGAPGTVAGVTGELAEDGAPVPTALVAVTVNV